ncbi:hypothetical protein BGZ54_001287 [Gamsiella multidivaricata]|nr:hypothetical protein BGZ54_001287 [Gamsiella multidivaricata]
MTDQQSQPPNNPHLPLLQERQQRQQGAPQSNTPHHYQHQNHIQFISSSPLPNPRQLFPDTSFRTRRAFHPASGGTEATRTPYGAINTPMRINTASANASAYQSGFVSPGPGTPKQKQVPLRTTKVSQKLVMLPEDQEEAEEDDTDFAEGAFSDPEIDAFRDESDFRIRKRVVAYCTAEGYDIKRLSAYLKANHGVQPRLYDEALYTAYHFPLIPGRTTRYMSAPPVRSPGGGSILDKQLEQYEENTGEVYSRSLEHADDEERYRRSTSGRDLTNEDYHQRGQLKNRRRASSRSSRHTKDGDIGMAMSAHEGETSSRSTSTAPESQDYFVDALEDQTSVIKSPSAGHAESIEALLTMAPQPAAAPFMGGEVFFFDYGVTVFWNMSVEQEAWILDDLSEFEVKRLLPDDVQIEEFHFEYAGYSTPRIYNDMITLRGGNHMIKLTISHAISQSVKLALYECQMDDTIDDTKIIPIQLAQTGKLNYSRPQITKISGHLFQLRMNVDLVSNVLDTPEIFWSEPELQPLYNAIRQYLEIGQRAKVLSDRCLVISDLLTMLRDDLASNNMNYITWIIIILIVIAVIVAAGEIVVKYLSHFGGEGAQLRL